MLCVCASIACSREATAQAQLDSLGIKGWLSTTSTLQVTSDSLLELPFISVFALDYERVLTLNRWSYNASYEWYGDRALQSGSPGPFFQMGSQGSTILREDTRSRTAETFNRFSGVIPMGPDWIQMKTMVSGATYHSGPPQGTFFIGDPNTMVDGFAIAGPTMQLGANTRIEGGYGVARQSNIAGGSFGSAMRFSGSLREEELSEQQHFNADALFDQRQYELRDQLYRTGRGRVSLRSNFEEGVTNEVSAGYELLLRDFFFAQNNDSSHLTKQRRNETSVLLQDRLYYPEIASNTAFNFEIAYAPRFVTRRSDAGNTLSTSISSISTILLPNALNAYRFTLDGGLRYAIFEPGELPFELSLRGRYEEQDEKAELLTGEIESSSAALVRRASDILNEVSFNSGATQLIAGATLGVHRDHNIAIQATGRIYRHSTPSPQNMDDRDDQLFTARATHEWRWHPDIVAVTELRMSQSHIVYLNSARSAQNNVTKAIALSHTSTYLTRNFFHRLTSEVFANYTVLDYYDRLPQLQSIGNYLLRGLAFRDSILARIGTTNILAPLDLSFQSQLELRFNERGSYDEKAFSERRSLLITEAGGEAAFGFRYARGNAPVSLHLGVRAFLYTRSGTTPTIQTNWREQERQWRLGPLVSLVLSDETGPELFGAFWHAFITTTNEALVTKSQQTEAHLGIRFRL